MNPSDSRLFFLKGTVMVILAPSRLAPGATDSPPICPQLRRKSTTTLS